jgi:hypothetical protein
MRNEFFKEGSIPFHSLNITQPLTAGDYVLVVADGPVSQSRKESTQGAAF